MSEFVDTASALINRQRICRSESEVEGLLDEIFAPAGQLRVISFVNAHAVMRATRDLVFRNALLRSDVILRDGTGMAMLMKRVERDPGLNMNGTDVIPRIIARAPRNAKLALLGTRDPSLSKAADRLRALGFGRIITADGFRPDSDYVDLVCAELPELVILAMGMPKQERISMRLAQNSTSGGNDIIVVNGGAILDFFSGTVPRAPAWMRSAGIEWLFRLLREPVRMMPRFWDSLSFNFRIRVHKGALRCAVNSMDEKTS